MGINDAQLMGINVQLTVEFMFLLSKHSLTVDCIDCIVLQDAEMLIIWLISEQCFSRDSAHGV